MATPGTALLLNTVTEFIQQVDRSKRFNKRDVLDELTETWTGPAVLEDLFVPAVGTRHPYYNLMTVSYTEIKGLPATVSEVAVHYHGKLANSSSGKYVSAPTIDTFWSEGEVSWQSSGSRTVEGIFLTVPYYTGPGGAPPPTTQQNYIATTQQKGIQQYSRRYSGKAVRISYITNARPSGNPTNLGLAQHYMGFANVYDIAGQFQPGDWSPGGVPSGVGITQGIIEVMSCADVSITDTGDGWYQVRETYQSRMFPTGGGGSG